MVRLKRKLPGATLIETLVAMTLIVTAISLSFLSVVSIKKSFNNDLRTYAYMIVNKHIEEVDLSIVDSEVLDYSSFSIRMSKEPYQNNPDLFVVTVSAVTQDSVILYEAKKVLKIKT
jgi:Tfp pilus assembly protein PilV